MTLPWFSLGWHEDFLPLSFLCSFCFRRSRGRYICFQMMSFYGIVWKRQDANKGEYDIGMKSKSLKGIAARSQDWEHPVPFASVNSLLVTVPSRLQGHEYKKPPFRLQKQQEQQTNRQKPQLPSQACSYLWNVLRPQERKRPADWVRENG